MIRCTISVLMIYSLIEKLAKIGLTRGLTNCTPGQVAPTRVELICVFFQDSGSLSSEHVPRETRADLLAREACLYPPTPYTKQKRGEDGSV